ncbi:hypothetical protein [Methylocella silvestris]|uniref:hypothetical protein n=1 Tax=Methylocella silvestris TaxID=199596 RepID=UPI001650AE6E|nr:hypothetical protein [Methylocella silvestris]
MRSGAGSDVLSPAGKDSASRLLTAPAAGAERRHPMRPAMLVNIISYEETYRSFGCSCLGSVFSAYIAGILPKGVSLKENLLTFNSRRCFVWTFAALIPWAAISYFTQRSREIRKEGKRHDKHSRGKGRN